jgi:hypothetical protein
MRSQESRAVSLPPLLEGNGFVRNSDLYGTGVIPTSRALWDSEPGSAARAPTTVRHARTTVRTMETGMARLHPYPVSARVPPTCDGEDA